MRLDTNLRYGYARLLGRLVATAWVSAVIAIILAIFLLLASTKEQRKTALFRAMISRETTALSISNGVTTRTSKDRKTLEWLSGTIPSLGLPATPSPAAALYELEKLLPNDVFLTSIEYDADGWVDLTATSKSSQHINDMLSKLQSNRVFRSTQVINQRETLGQYAVHIKLSI